MTKGRLAARDLQGETDKGKKEVGDLTTGEVVPTRLPPSTKPPQRNGQRQGEVGWRLNHRGSRPNLAPAPHETSKPGSLACSPSFDSPPDAYSDKGCLTGVDVRSGTARDLQGETDKGKKEVGDLTTGEVVPTRLPPSTKPPQRNGQRQGEVGWRLNHRGSRPNLAPAQHETSKPGSLACSPSFDSPPDAYKDKGCLTGVDVGPGTGDKPGGHTLQRDGRRRARGSTNHRGNPFKLSSPPARCLQRGTDKNQEGKARDLTTRGVPRLSPLPARNLQGGTDMGGEGEAKGPSQGNPPPPPPVQHETSKSGSIQQAANQGMSVTRLLHILP
ncbi:UNVERIFIED_CONTAM: hypothetical protein FKN15_061792 [Acipenser sinensis]